MQAIYELELLGFSLWLEEGNIKYLFQGRDRPDPTVVKPLLEELKARKAEAVEYLQARKQDKVIDFAAEAEKLKEALSRQGIVKIKSEALGEEVYWARDNKEVVKAPAGAVVYTIDELRHLYSEGTTREGLRRVYEAKKLFGGRLVNEDKNPFKWG